MHQRTILFSMAAALLAFSVSVADDDSEMGRPTTHMVARGLFKVAVELEGVFVAEHMTEVAVRPESWSELSVTKALAHGTRVSQGDVLVQFDTQEIDDTIADLEAEQKLKDLAIVKAENELPQLERSLTLDFVAAEREQKIAGEDLKRFRSVDRPLATKSADFSLQNATHQLEYATEELRQLEKMYEADDLTEETEEIILKRQRNRVENTRFNVERSKIDRDTTLQITMPRQEESFEEKQEQTQLAVAKTKDALSLNLNEKRFELDKLKHTRARDLEKHAKLVRDRDRLTVRAPAGGVVYYGRYVDGNWPDISSMSAKLRPDGTASAREVLMTIVEPRPLSVRTVVPEKDLQNVRPGTDGRIVPTGTSKERLAGKVDTISPILVADGKFVAKITVTLDQDSELTAGRTCKVNLAAYEQQDALTVPLTALETDPVDEEQYYVKIVTLEGEHERRNVTVGRQNETDAEILEGLEVGDQVLLGKEGDDTE